MRRRRTLRPGLRTMMVLVAIAGLLSAILLNWIPRALRQQRVADLLRDQYRSLLDDKGRPIQAFWRLDEKSPLDLATMKSEAWTVAAQLLAMVERPGDPAGGLPLEWKPNPSLPASWAVDRLGEWVVRADSVPIGREVTARLLDLAASGKLAPEVETTALSVMLLELAPRLGLDDSRRAEILAQLRALAVGPNPRAGLRDLWARLACEVGDREAVLALLEQARHDPALARVVATSTAVADCRWPGLVAPLIRLAEASDEPRVFLNFAAFHAGREGRDALVAYAREEAHPLPERRLAIHRLKRDPAGVAHLLEACDDPAHRGVVAEFFGRDHAGQPGDPPPLDVHPTRPYAREAADLTDPRPELRRLLDDLGRMDDPWPTLFRELDPETWVRRPAEPGTPQAEVDRRALARAAHMREVVAEAIHQPCPISRADWDAHHPGEALPGVAWKDWFAALDRFPDARDRLGGEFSLASLPGDCIPVLARIARSPSSPHRLAALRLLVLRSDRLDEVPLLIEAFADQVDREPDRLAGRDVEALRILHRRFAVDFSRDLTAWRAWWLRESSPTP